MAISASPLSWYRACLIEVLAHAVDRFDASVLAYCLMGNHYHFVLQTRQGNLSRFMRHVNGVYAQAFNRRHGLVGHVFQGRFKAIHVDRTVYLLEVCRYTELNPVRARMVEAPGEWPWSSYRAHCGLIEGPVWLDSATLHETLLGFPAKSAGDRCRAELAYKALVAAGQDVNLWDALRQEIYLGDDAFIQQAQESALRPARRNLEIPEVQRRLPTPQTSWTFEGPGRDESLLRAYVEGSMNMSQIARAAGLSVSRVSRLIARLEGGCISTRLRRDSSRTQEQD